MNNEQNVVRLNNDALCFENFSLLTDKYIFVRHSGVNSLILIAQDQMTEDVGNYFTLTDNCTYDKDVIEYFTTHNAINSVFICKDNIYYQTQLKA